MFALTVCYALFAKAVNSGYNTQTVLMHGVVRSFVVCLCNN